MGRYYGTGVGLWGGVVPLLAMVVFWGAIIWAACALFKSSGYRSWSGRHPGGPPGHTKDPNDPETILARRYASGEIDDDEYHRRLDHLRSRDPEREKEGIWRP